MEIGGMTGNVDRGAKIRGLICWGIFLLGVLTFATGDSDAAGKSASAGDSGKAPVQSDGRTLVVAIPVIDPERGSRLFVSKGCVICHSVNNIGGKAGPPLDAPEGNAVVNVFEFAARMWAGSFAMIELQGMELGYQLEMNGEELGHIAAFVYDKKAQGQFRESDVPDLIKDMIIREPYVPGKGLDDPRP